LEGSLVSTDARPLRFIVAVDPEPPDEVRQNLIYIPQLPRWAEERPPEPKGFFGYTEAAEWYTLTGSPVPLPPGQLAALHADVVERVRQGGGAEAPH
jgi:hypothetical protein